MNRNILIVSSFFEPQYSYQEVQIADTLNKLGYDVSVLTSDSCQFNKRKRVVPVKYRYKIFRLKKFFRLTSTLYPLEKVDSLIREIDPFICILVHPNLGFPYFLLDKIPNNCKTISIFGDTKNRNYYQIKKRVVNRLIKDRWYKACFKRSDLIVANTNETIDIFKERGLIGSKDLGKIIVSGLGYNPDRFYLDYNERERKRALFNIEADDIALITITRITENKPFKNWLGPAISAMKQNSKLRYFLVGFSSSAYCNEIKEWILSSRVSRRFILRDFASPNEINALYNACDFAVWYDCSISIQQSMGSGIFNVVPWKRSIDHCFKNNVNGYYYNNEIELAQFLMQLDVSYDRLKLAKLNSKYSYVSIIENLLEKAISI